jgi:hypothetical protein
MSFYRQLVMPLELLFCSAAIYFTHLILIAISIIPAAIRATQMLDNKYLSSHALEAVAGISRVVLVFAIIGVGTNASIIGILSGQALTESFYESFLYAKVAWPSIILQVILFGLLFGLINLLIGHIVRKVSAAESPAASSSRKIGVGNAVLFVIKNALIIPISLIYLLRVVGLIPKH